MGFPVETGTVLDGRYRVERVIGMGAMGVVVAAQHIALRERVAVKFLKRELTESRTILARFEREARAATRIKSEHIARVRDVGRLETGEPYMVMEFLEGLDLSAYVRERGPLPLREAADYVLQACEALAEAHSLGIVHRDLKPENLFLTKRPDGSACIKVLDFGISKFSEGGDTSGFAGTVAGGLVGSPLYMSPEQISAAPDVDSRSDVWAIGVILFELLTGRTPFSGSSLPQVCMAITARPPKSLSALRPELPVRVERLIEHCLEKERSKRFATIADFARRLAEFGTEQGRISATRAGRIAAGVGASSTSEAVAPSSKAMAATEISLPPRLPEDDRQVPRVALVVGAAGVVLIGLAVALVTARDGRSSPDAPGTALSAVAAHPEPAPAPSATTSAVSAAAPSAEPMVSVVEAPPLAAGPALSAARPAVASRPPPAAPRPASSPPPPEVHPLESVPSASAAPAPKAPSPGSPPKKPGSQKSLGGRL